MDDLRSWPSASDAFRRHWYDIRRSNSKAAEKLGPGREGSFSEGNAYRLPPPALSKRNAWRFCEVVLSPIIYTTSHLDKLILRLLLVAPNHSATSLHASQELCATCKSSLSPSLRCADFCAIIRDSTKARRMAQKISTQHTHPNIHTHPQSALFVPDRRYNTTHLFKACRSSPSCRTENVSLISAQSSHPIALSRPLPR